MKKFIIVFISLVFTLIIFSCTSGPEQETAENRVNIAVIASLNSSSGFRSAESTMVLSDGIIPVSGEDLREGVFVLWSSRRSTTSWVEYEWTLPVKTSEVGIYWMADDERIFLPDSFTLSYWCEDEYVPVRNISGGGMGPDQMNIITMDEVETTKLRLEIENIERRATGILEWEVISSDNTVKFPPVVSAGIDRSVIVGGKTYLRGSYKSVNPIDKLKWKKVSGKGKVSFDDADAAQTTASFSEPGEYILRLEARSGKLASSSEIEVKAITPPPEERLNVVYTKNYKIDNPLWDSRAKAIIVNWIPWCIDQINSTDLETGQGGIDNFIEAAKALRGEPHGPHKGYVFSNAWVHQTIESMSIALMVDAKGDPEILAAQDLMRKTIEDWIPKILAAQEPDGYMQTAYTLRDTTRWHERWSPENRTTHEGYVAGYFIESAINHYTLTKGEDTRLYDAAKKLADCWVDNIQPGKNEWYNGHQEMEQALVRFGRFVNDMEGNGRGDAYIDLAKFLLDNRDGGSEYDQSHVPVQEQYEAVGHAVRAVYSYSGMADVAAETGDTDYQSAVMSLWDNMINRKYYVTGGVGSGETSEGFGPNYSLRHNAYCESCSSCGLIFFQYKMNLAYRDAKYADLYEETMYNALLGSLDLEGRNFYYTNPMTQTSDRYSWHVCPCCVGNIPRTLLMVPTWTYVTEGNGIYVNLFIGSTINIEKVAGTDVEMIQKTDYPWDGKVSVTVNPKESKSFRVYIRVPNRHTSVLYKSVPEVNGLKSMSVNGEDITPPIENGYAIIDRTWEKGDRIDFELPMEVQVITSDEKIAANTGLIALRYGPLVFNVENVDQPDINRPVGSGEMTAEWREDMLEGIMTIKGEWENGSPLLAIPYYARQNRELDIDADTSVTSRVWIKR
ncbi:MAG: beta-L-arabinofuranosidase domain-containing protein [Marinilabiliaceae bacterium]|jgi:DUF1680 family protein|nr:beta-L-arabinofuranosidase domain-containing protein [Marinilabiliaceae bacterium]